MIWPLPSLSRRFFRHSRSVLKVYWYPSGLATGMNQSSVLWSSFFTSLSLARHWSTYQFMSRRSTSVAIHSRACWVAL